MIEDKIKEIEFLENLKESLKKDFIPVPETMLMKTWLWFQKHAFTSILFIALGVIIGISNSKIVYEREMTRAINIQRFEFKGDLFDIQPSAIKKYYDTKIMEKTNVK